VLTCRELSATACRSEVTGDLTKGGKQRPASLNAFGNVSVPGTGAGAIVSIGLVVIAWVTIPVARPFLLRTAAAGGLIGSVLWWKHSR
jgi:hypothetical protein